MTRNEQKYSPNSLAPSPLPPKKAAQIRIPTSNFVLLSTRRANTTCREKISIALSNAAPVAGRMAFKSMNCSTKRSVPAMSPSLSKRQAKTETAPSAKSRAYSQRTTGSSFRPDPFHFSFRKSAKSPWKHPPNPTKPSNSMP